MTTDYTALSERIQARVDEFAYRFLQKTAEHLHANTPVVTGRMRGSWNITTSAARAAEGNQYFTTPAEPRIPKRSDARQKMMTNVSRMAITAPTGAMQGAFSGLIGFKVQAGKPVYIVNTARAPHNDYYYPAKVEDKRGVVRSTYQALAGFAEEAAREAAAGGGQ
jgi:hypothetical protein